MTRAADDEARRRWGREAAEALVALAATGDDAELRSLLTPDPRNHNVTWTVACYQVGDLTPSAVRDFSDPGSAIATLAACPDTNHVAAELVASTSLGLRWSALSRTNTTRQFRLPDAESASDASHEHASELTEALRRWRAQLSRWADGDDVDVRPVVVAEPAAVAVAAVGAPVGGAPAPAPPAALPPVPPSPVVITTGGDPRVAERLDAIERSLVELAAAAKAIADKVRAVDERVSLVAREVARHGAGAETAADRVLREVSSLAAAEDRHAESAELRARSGQDHLSELVAALAAAVAHRDAQVDERLSTLERRLGQAIVQATQVVTGRIRGVATAVARVDDRAETRQVELGELVHDEAQRAVDAAEALEALLAAQANRLDAQTERIDAHGSDLVERIGALESTFGASAAGAIAAVEDGTAAVRSVVAEGAAAVEAAVAAHASALDEAAATRAADLRSQLTSARHVIAEAVASQADELDHALARVAARDSDVAAAIAAHRAELRAAVADQRRALDAAFAVQAAELAAVLERAGAVLDERATTPVAVLTELDALRAAIARIEAEQQRLRSWVG